MQSRCPIFRLRLPGGGGGGCREPHAVKSLAAFTCQDVSSLARGVPL